MEGGGGDADKDIAEEDARQETKDKRPEGLSSLLRQCAGTSKTNRGRTGKPAGGGGGGGNDEEADKSDAAGARGPDEPDGEEEEEKDMIQN
jgi:hypothetical protein